jgi:hypothetical protein
MSALLGAEASAQRIIVQIPGSALRHRQASAAPRTSAPLRASRDRSGHLRATGRCHWYEHICASIQTYDAEVMPEFAGREATHAEPKLRELAPGIEDPNPPAATCSRSRRRRSPRSSRRLGDKAPHAARHRGSGRRNPDADRRPAGRTPRPICRSHSGPCRLRNRDEGGGEVMGTGRILQLWPNCEC